MAKCALRPFFGKKKKNLQLGVQKSVSDLSPSFEIGLSDTFFFFYKNARNAHTFQSMKERFQGNENYVKRCASPRSLTHKKPHIASCLGSEVMSVLKKLFCLFFISVFMDKKLFYSRVCYWGPRSLRPQSLVELASKPWTVVNAKFPKNPEKSRKVTAKICQVEKLQQVKGFLPKKFGGLRRQLGDFCRKNQFNMAAAGILKIGIFSLLVNWFSPQVIEFVGFFKKILEEGPLKRAGPPLF